MKTYHRTREIEIKDAMVPPTIPISDESAGALRANHIIPLEQTIEQLEARLAGFEGVEWADFGLPNDHNEAQYVFGVIQTSLFNRMDALKMVGDKAGPQGSEVPVFDFEGGNNLPAEEKDEKPDQEKSKLKRPHPTLKDKLRVQAKALELLDDEQYKDYYAPHLADIDEIVDISKKKNGNFYSREKIIEWINEVLPDDKKLKGAPPKIT